MLILTQTWLKKEEMLEKDHEFQNEVDLEMYLDF